MSTRVGGGVSAASLAAALGERLTTVSQRLVAAAAATDWATVETLLAEREPVTRALGALDPTRLDAPARERLRVAITAALTLDRQVQAEAHACQEALRVEMQRAHQGRRALGAYTLPPEPEDAHVLDKTG